MWCCCTEFHRTRVYHFLINFVLFFHVTFGICIGIVLTKSLTIRSKDILGVTNDTIKFGGLQIIYWLSIFAAFSNRAHQRNFWKLFDKIDRKYCSHRQFCLKNFFIIIAFYAFYYVFMEVIYIIISQKLSENYRTFWYYYGFICKIYQNRSFYYYFYLKLIQHELKQIEREIKMLIDDFQNYEQNTNKIFKKFAIERLKWIRNYYALIHELCNIMNRLNGIFHAFYFPFLFLLTTTEINWIYWKLYNQHPSRKMIGKNEGKTIAINLTILFTRLFFVDFCQCNVNCFTICWCN